ncbi:MAG: hypothetical protein GX442_25010 [Candidatus Riflebacteria bacterium]|nr:hypothetical protein [Candidatus Riflebacteria bacterium]
MANLAVMALVFLQGVLGSFVPLSAQSRAYVEDLAWQHVLGGTTDEAYHGLVLLADGGCVAAGFSNSRDGDLAGAHGRKDVLVVRYGADGKPAWTKLYGGPENDLAQAIDQTSDGGFVVAGSTFLEDPAIGYHGGTDVLLMRLDSAGNLLWKRCFGGNGEDTAYAVRQAGDGGFLLACGADSLNGDVATALGGTDAWVVKVTAAGALQWATSLGGPLDDLAASVEPTADGGCVVAGRVASHTAGEDADGFGLGNVLVARLDASGTVLWQKDYGGVDEERAYAVRPTSDGGFVVAGTASSLSGIPEGWMGGLDAWVLKLDASGTIEWQSCYGGVADDLAYSIREAADGGFVFCGEAASFDGDVEGTHGGSDLWLVGLDAGGTLLWQKTLGGRFDEAGFDLRETADGNWLVGGKGVPSGGDDVPLGHAGYDAWLLKVLTP